MCLIGLLFSESVTGRLPCPDLELRDRHLRSKHVDIPIVYRHHALWLIRHVL